MYWTILLLANVPLFILVGWLVFDTKETAADSFADSLISLVYVLLVGSWVRLARDQEGLWEVALFLLVCAAIVYGEHFLLSSYFFQ